MNKIILIGRLTKDVELRYTQVTNTAVASFTLAVDRKFTKSDNEKQTDFFNVIAWNKLAENISKYLSKGKQVAISGRLETRSWNDESGQKHNTIEIIAEEASFIDPKNKKNNEEPIRRLRDENIFSDWWSRFHWFKLHSLYV